MSCKNCFNGCVTTVSDKCVMYTGASYPALGIETGDSLLMFLTNGIDGLVSQILDAQLYKNRMIPYSAVEYYGDVDVDFDSTGEGIGVWEDIYLCNGNNGTPDKRGRVGVGSTDIVGGLMDADVDPSNPGNPNYALGDTPSGENTATMLEANLAEHKHVVSLSAENLSHTHQLLSTADNAPVSQINYVARSTTNPPAYTLYGSNVAPTEGVSGSGGINDHNHTATVENTGSGTPFSIIQPVLVCNYVMYIPK
jgi:microcystin-dependent protein